MALTTFVIWAALVAVAFGEVATIHPCENVDAAKCTISEVRIIPCRVNKACRFKQGSNVSMDFDFTPNFNTDKLKTAVFSPNQFTGNRPFTGLGSDNACEYTKCPTVAGEQQVFSYSLHIGSKLPAGDHRFKWTVYNEDNENEKCCFMTNIHIQRTLRNKKE